MLDGQTRRGVLGNRAVDLHQFDCLSFLVRVGIDDVVLVEAALPQFFRIDFSLREIFINFGVVIGQSLFVTSI